ncbi:unnamed protein product [Lampetra planeri]
MAEARLQPVTRAPRTWRRLSAALRARLRLSLRVRGLLREEEEGGECSAGPREDFAAKSHRLEPPAFHEALGFEAASLDCEPPFHQISIETQQAVGP